MLGFKFRTRRHECSGNTVRRGGSDRGGPRTVITTLKTNTAGARLAMAIGDVRANMKHSLWVAQQWTARQARADIYREVEAFCKAEKCGAKRALTRNPQWVGLISATSLTRRLSVEVVTGKENITNGILTDTERTELAACLNAAGKHMCSYTLQERNEAVLNILRYRQKLNRSPASGGRAYKKLPRAARSALDRVKCGRGFWKAFFVEFADLVFLRRRMSRVFRV